MKRFKNEIAPASNTRTTENDAQFDPIYICSAPIENLVRFWNRTTMLPGSGTGYPVLEPAAPFEIWTSTLVFSV